VRAGITQPRIGVCGINPHAGENGLFGYGEEEEDHPRRRTLKARGWDVEGPLPADTLFYRAGRGDFDVVVAMPRPGPRSGRVMGLEAGVNVTVGLPVIRRWTTVPPSTSPAVASPTKEHAGSAQAGTRLAAPRCPGSLMHRPPRQSRRGR
jgi:4-hydroxy-L-threonine phosphate dehydrogenase PdxA